MCPWDLGNIMLLCLGVGLVAPLLKLLFTRHDYVLGACGWALAWHWLCQCVVP